MGAYLDNAATMKLLPEAKAAMLEVMNGEYGNASSLHRAGHAAKEVVEDVRRKIAKLINAEPDEIIFTSGGSEANNTVMHIFAGQKVAVSSVEHPSVIAAAKEYAREVVMLPVDEWGRVKLDDVERVIREDGVSLVSVMFANNELGTIEPVEKIAKCCKANHVKFHVDATQAFGKVKIDVKALNIDYLTISAHKIGGPIGIGALYVRKGSPYKPLIFGGHQENGRRAGTTNTMLIAGFGAAVEWCWENWSCRQWAEVAGLRDELRRRILTEVPYSSCNSPEGECLPNILNMSFSAAEGESIQLYLDLAEIQVGTGSACAAGDLQPSHVIMATVGDAEVAHSSIRFSLGLDTTRKDIDKVMAALPGIVRKLQDISTIKVPNISEREL